MKRGRMTITYNRLPELSERMHAVVREIVRATARHVSEVVAFEISSAKSGREYGLHRASAPGEAPADYTGELLDGMKVRMTGPTTAEVSFPRAYYALFLEYGTAKMAARPFLHPSVEAERPRFIGELQMLERKL